MLIRNVGHLMTTPAILTKNNDEIGRDNGCNYNNTHCNS